MKMISKNNKPIKTVLFIALAVFFGLQFLSRLVSSLGSRTGSPGLYKVGALCFPVEAEPFYRYGFSLLRESTAGDSAGRDKGISFLERSLFLNPFNFRAHFDLGNAYLSRRPLTEDMFKKGIAALKRTVRLGGGKNTDVTRRALELMLDSWPRLSDKEKQLCRQLLKSVVGKTGKENFQALLGRWEASSRDVTLFEGVLETAPQYYDLTAAALTRLEIEPELRRLFKLNHEIYILEDVGEEYKKLSNRSTDLIERLKTLRLRLKQNITGYYKLVRNSKFKQQNYGELLTRLNFHILSRFFHAGSPGDPPQQREEMENFLLACIDDFSSGNELEQLYRFLDKNNFFSSGSVRSLYIKGLILFKKRDYAATIAHLERVKYDVSTEYGTHGDEYRRSMLLLSDAYISSRLLTRALTVHSEIDVRSSRSSSSVVMDMYLQKVKIEYITGPETVENNSRSLSKYYDLFNRSRSIELLDRSFQTDVYLVSGGRATRGSDNDGKGNYLDINEIEIRPGRGLKEKVKDRHLLQVFVDGNIRHEVYLGQLDFDKPLHFKISPFERFSKHSIKVIIL